MLHPYAGTAARAPRRQADISRRVRLCLPSSTSNATFKYFRSGAPSLTVRLRTSSADKLGGSYVDTS